MASSGSEKPACDVWVAVLHYQGPEHTQACLRSIQKLQYGPFKILITDNFSPDRSGSEIAKAFPDCNYLPLDDNLGFAGGANASINYCIERGARFVWLLNNDTELESDSLSALMKIALSDPRSGVLGAIVSTPTENGYRKSGSGEIDYIKAKTYERGIVDETQESKACQWISGSNMLFRADAFKQIGGFDENFFLYFEDTDICCRLNEAGWKCLLVPSAKIHHIGNASTQGKLAIWRSYYHTRNRLLFFLKKQHGIATIPAVFSISAHLLRHSIVLPFRGEDGKRQLKAELLGLSDFLAGKFGKASCLDF